MWQGGGRGRGRRHRAAGAHLALGQRRLRRRGPQVEEQGCCCVCSVARIVACVTQAVEASFGAHTSPARSPAPVDERACCCCCCCIAHSLQVSSASLSPAACPRSSSSSPFSTPALPSFNLCPAPCTVSSCFLHFLPYLSASLFSSASLSCGEVGCVLLVIKRLLMD